MKKTILMLGAGVALLMGAASCSNNAKSNADADSSCTECTGDCAECQGCGNSCDSDCDMMFTGVLPGADVAGIRYDLKLDFDKAGNGGDYKLAESYLKCDAGAKSCSDSVTYKSKGNFTVNEATGGKKYLKLVRDDENSSKESAETLYFLCDTDSTLTLTNADLKAEATPGLNYTLTLKK